MKQENYWNRRLAELVEPTEIPSGETAGRRCSGSISQKLRTHPDQRKGRCHGGQQFQRHVPRRTAGTGEYGSTTRRCLAAHGGGRLASRTEASAGSSSRGNRDPKGAIADNPAETWRQSHSAY